MTLPLVMLAAFGALNLLLSAAVAVVWHRVGHARPARADAVLCIRLLPAIVSATLVLTVVLPAFLLHEPPHAHDEPGPLLVVLALFALAALADGVRRGLNAWRDAHALMHGARTLPGRSVSGTVKVSLVEVNAPLVAVVGGWRQRIIADPCVAAACDREEFHQVLAHETAHMDARDNLKLFAMLAAPDALAWLPAGRALTQHWRDATELEADERASGADPRKRLALASALIKVARLSIASAHPRGSARVNSGIGGIEARVRLLLAPCPKRPRGSSGLRLVACALVLPLLAVPLYAPIHHLIEILVVLGR